MNILDKIIADKKKEVRLKKQLVQPAELERRSLFKKDTVSLSNALREAEFGIIAEHKRRSPSKSAIKLNGSLPDIVRGYTQAGASAISVLTDGKYFGGSLDDLLLARASTAIPLLRKEFIIDEYQVLEARAYGADLILLIAAVLDTGQIRQLSELAKSLGMEVLLEVHNLKELQQSLLPGIDLVGVNNRDLKSFRVSLDTSKDLSGHIPDDFIKVSESGIGSAEDIKQLIQHGFKGFLMGEHFMKMEDPGIAAADFIKNIRS